MAAEVQTQTLQEAEERLTKAAQELSEAASGKPMQAQQAQSEGAQYDVDIDNMTWEVETEKPGEEIFVNEGCGNTDKEQYYDTGHRVYSSAMGYKTIDKHLFTWGCSLALGMYGVDRFVRGQIGLGIAKLLTFGGAGIWWLIDLIVAVNKSYTGTFEYENILAFDENGMYAD